ncbi:glycoside hydrolase [Erwinia sp. CPCC 100877]|nr:glycoside hydrolase [Erwinia sp. CPCC 100877]
MSIRVTPQLLRGIASPYKTVVSKKIAQAANINTLPFHLNHWFTVYEINKNKLRVAHFLAQACCETDQFLSLTEIPAHGGKEYEPTTRAGRLVGNKYPGDGPKYIGRGLLHLTGRENYEKYGNRIHKDLVNHPKIVASDLSLAVRTSCMFWHSRGLNTLADSDNFNAISHRVNGGHNGRDVRLKALKKAKALLGI